MENVAQLTGEETQQNLVTFVIPSASDATQLREFTEKVRQIFSARVLEIIGSWKETLITFQVDKTITVSNMLDKLVKMPEVQGAQEKQINNQGMSKGILVTLAGSAIGKYIPGELMSQNAGVLEARDIR